MRLAVGMLALLSMTTLMTTLVGCGFARQTVSVKTLYERQRDPLTAAEHVRLGELYRAEGKWELAERELHQALRDRADYAPAWSALGVLAYQRGQLAQAEEYFRQALRLAPADRDILNNLAWTYVKHAAQAPHDVPSGAVRQLIARLEPAARQPGGSTHYYWDTLGMLYLQVGEVERARACFQQAWELTPPEDNEFIQELARHQALTPAAASAP